MNIRFTSAERPDDFAAIADLATIIWTEHYTPIVGQTQVAYMLEKFQSAGALAAQIADQGYVYTMVWHDEQLVGYAGVRMDGDGLLLSKFYVLKAFRGRGVGRRLFEQVTRPHVGPDALRVWLTVNKWNAGAIAVYTRLGFVVEREQAAEIGEGYVMDDYIMVLTLPAAHAPVAMRRSQSGGAKAVDMLPELDAFLSAWKNGPDDGAKPLFQTLYACLAGLDGVSLEYRGRPGVSHSLRARHAAQRERKLFVLVDVIDDDPEARWLSVCFYADLVTDPEGRGDIVPGGLDGDDACCFDIDDPNADLEVYMTARLHEACAKAAAGQRRVLPSNEKGDTP